MLNSIVGILDNGAAAGGGTSFESIATVTVGYGGTSTITFSSIPSTYSHLQIRGVARSAEAATGTATLRMRLNSDTANNYSVHNLGGDGATASADAGSNFGYMYAGYAMPKNSATSNTFGGLVIDILDYANTNKYKTIRNLNGVDLNGSGFIALSSSNWRSTSTVSSIDIYFNLNNVAQYSHFALYGIKGA